MFERNFCSMCVSLPCKEFPRILNPVKPSCVTKVCHHQDETGTLVPVLSTGALKKISAQIIFSITNITQLSTRHYQHNTAIHENSAFSRLFLRMFIILWAHFWKKLPTISKKITNFSKKITNFSKEFTKFSKNLPSFQKVTNFFNIFTNVFKVESKWNHTHSLLKE